MSAFIISLPALKRNALILRDVADAAGCRISNGNVKKRHKTVPPAFFSLKWDVFSSFIT